MNLFCYGTLMHPQIFNAVVGRTLRSMPVCIHGYQIYSIRSAAYPAIIPCGTATVDGLVYQGLSPGEMRLLDDYEGCEYQRRLSTIITAGHTLSVWAYVFKPQFRNRLGGQGWDYERFVERHLADYLKWIRQ